jgi:hypothetical protein
MATYTRLLLTVGLPIVFIAAWALVVAPNTVNGLSQPQKDVIGTVLLLAAAGALALVGQVPIALGFAVVVIANAALMLVFGADARDALNGMAR